MKKIDARLSQELLAFQHERRASRIVPGTAESAFSSSDLETVEANGLAVRTVLSRSAGWIT